MYWDYWHLNEDDIMSLYGAQQIEHVHCDENFMECKHVQNIIRSSMTKESEASQIIDDLNHCMSFHDGSVEFEWISKQLPSFKPEQQHHTNMI